MTECKKNSGDQEPVWMPFITIDEEGQVYLAWLDRSGARVVSWKDEP